MNEQEVRAVVREVLARRLGSAAAEPPGAPRVQPDARWHASHGLLPMAPAVQEGQPCIIEPQVACALCGFCQSLGH